MTRTTRTLTFALGLGLALSVTACRGGGGGGGGDGGDDTGDDAPDANGNPDDATIYSIQDGTIAVGTEVNVRGVVVTAIDNYGERKGNIWVAEPEGGAYSGVLVYGIDLSTVSDLAVGDLIDLEHVVIDEFALTEDTSGRTTTELTPPDGGQIVVTVVGDGTVPAPAAVDALAIGQMADAGARDAEWEKWEGVLITLTNVSALSELRQIGSTPQDPPFEEFQVTGPLRVDTSLAAINPVTRDECLASVTGIGDYFFNYKLLPRSTDAVVTGGTGCPAQEAEAATCEDGTDNEADGFADCADFSCQQIPECQTASTVVQVQMGQVTGTVVLDNVVVTALTFDRKSLWVADAATAAEYNGVYVFRGSSAEPLPAEVTVGATVDVTGNVAEYNNNDGDGTLTQITQPTVTFVAGAPAVPTPLTDVPLATLVDPTTGEPYEGVFVQIGPVEVTMAPDEFGVAELSDGTTTVLVDDTVHRPMTSPYTVGKCFTQIGGVWNYNVFENAFAIEPISGLFVVEDADGSDCN